MLAVRTLLLWLALVAPADDHGATTFKTAVPPHGVEVLAARPTDTSVTFTVVVPDAQIKGSGTFFCTPLATNGVQKKVPDPFICASLPAIPSGTTTLRLDGLQPDTGYRWELRGANGPLASGACHTQRPPGATFSFTVTADSHLDEQTDLDLYARTLTNIAADAPDFNVDLGDTFMTEKYPGDFHAARAQYLAQHYWFSLTRTPLFLALGNHDGELGWLLGDGPDNIVRWSCALRKSLFPNPEPGGVFTGNATPEGESGLPQNYYAWQWGDAQFIVLDPFWPTRTRPNRRADPWVRTLGEAQYRWLAATLATSRAPYKFVFIHHLAGGADLNGRGGSEAATRYEWGGRNADGTPGFAAHRPGWEAPIHDLLRRADVTAVFHGHDHFYAHQALDGIVYQMAPQPGHPGQRLGRQAAEYGYQDGVLLGGAGHLRVTVGPQGVTVAFVRAVLPANERGDWRNGALAESYTLPPRAR